MSIASNSTVIILGSTGSIGTQGLDVISRHPERFTVTGLAAGGAHIELLAQQAAQFHVSEAAVFDETKVPALQAALAQAGAQGVRVTGGPDSVIAMAGSGANVVLNGITGSIGLEPSIAALKAGSQLALANKESVVAGGHLLFSAQVRENQINPVDSEHSAIWQSLRSGTHAEVAKLVVTASGGPFRGWKRADMENITPEQALHHPTWNMGPVVTINSSTLMNKGLEVIEAHHLFGLPGERIDVLVHPQSLVHSLVEFIDGSTLAQLGLPDMRTTLAVGLGWPLRIASGVGGLDLRAHGRLDFEAPDLDAFPCLRLAYGALAAGGTAPAMLNALDEIVVSAFLQGRIAFLDIPAIIEDGLAALPVTPADSIDALLEADARARAFARERCGLGGTA